MSTKRTDDEAEIWARSEAFARAAGKLSAGVSYIVDGQLDWDAVDATLDGVLDVCAVLGEWDAG